MTHIKKYIAYKIDNSYEFGFGLDNNYHKSIIPRELFASKAKYLFKKLKIITNVK